MSTFDKNAITMKGAVAIAALVAGGTLEFTRISVGDGELTAGQTPFTMTDLAHHLFDVDIQEVYSDTESQATITGIFSNAATQTGFFYRELGLFAKDPATGAEILFCYGNAGESAEWISAAGEESLIEKEVHIVTLIGNATTVTATLKSGIYATREQMDAALAMKADLDAKAEEGGRVVPEQMRFDASQTLYVDAAAAEGGDGSAEKPFKTIQAAINARYMGAPVIYIKIKPGTYAEDLTTPRAPGTTWRFTRDGEGTVAANTAIFDNAAYLLLDGLTFSGPKRDNSTLVYVANTPSIYINNVTVNGATDATGINCTNCKGVIRNSSFNGCGLAIAATDGSHISLREVSGVGNARGIQSDASTVICDWYVPGAVTPYERLRGGVIIVQGGSSTVPSNWAQRLSLGDFTDAEALKTAILAEFGKLGVGESRYCWFANNVTGGFGPFGSGQRMVCDINKSTDYNGGYGIVLFYSHHDAPSGFMRIRDGVFHTDVPIRFISQEDRATTSEYGLVRMASEAAVLAETKGTAVDSNLIYEINDFRRMGKAYEVGDRVDCAFVHDLFLECTQAGTTSTQTLDTRNVTHGQVIKDGTVQWTVRTHVRSVAGNLANKDGDVDIKDLLESTIPVGTIIWSAATSAPSGYLLCNGATVGRTTYPQLFAAIGTTFGAGDGSTTFGLPNLIDRVMWGGTSPGAYLEAGLPGLNGKLESSDGGELFVANTVTASGALSVEYGDVIAGQASNQVARQVTAIVITGSDSSEAYGKSDTVQPPALKLVPYIKAFSAATNQGMIDITSLSNEISALNAERLAHIGEIDTFAVTELPDGWMICDGSAVMFSDWPEFAQVYNEGRFAGMTLSEADPAQVGKLVINGSTGVYLPDLEGLFVQASAASAAGAYVAPGLPNILASAGGRMSVGDSRTGAFSGSSTVVRSISMSGSSGIYGTLNFNASLHSNVYSDAVTTVQPPAVRYVLAMYLGRPKSAEA